MYVRRCLTQRVSDGSYVERDAFLRECLKEYPHIQSPLWKQMVASAYKVPVVSSYNCHPMSGVYVCVLCTFPIMKMKIGCCELKIFRIFV